VFGGGGTDLRKCWYTNDPPQHAEIQHNHCSIIQLFFIKYYGFSQLLLGAISEWHIIALRFFFFFCY